MNYEDEINELWSRVEELTNKVIYLEHTTTVNEICMKQR